MRQVSHRCFMVTASLAFLMVWACEKAQREEVIWSDPAGDVSGNTVEGNTPQGDVTKVTSFGKDGYLHIEAEFHVGPKDVMEHTGDGNTKFGRSLLRYYIDTTFAEGDQLMGKDVDRETEDYDYEAVIQLCLVFESDSGPTCGDFGKSLDEDKLINTFARYTLAKMRGEHGMIEYLERDSYRGDKEDAGDDLTNMNSNTIEIRIPYELLSVKEGDTLRICFEESRAFSEDQTVTLR